MAHKIAKMLTDDDGRKYPNSYWHLYSRQVGADTILCTKEVFGSGEGGARAEVKEVQKGGINCPACLAIINRFKAIEL